MAARPTAIHQSARGAARYGPLLPHPHLTVFIPSLKPRLNRAPLFERALSQAPSVFTVRTLSGQTEALQHFTDTLMGNRTDIHSTAAASETLMKQLIVMDWISIVFSKLWLWWSRLSLSVTTYLCNRYSSSVLLYPVQAQPFISKACFCIGKICKLHILFRVYNAASLSGKFRCIEWMSS